MHRTLAHNHSPLVCRCTMSASPLTCAASSSFHVQVQVRKWIRKLAIDLTPLSDDDVRRLEEGVEEDDDDFSEEDATVSIGSQRDSSSPERELYDYASWPQREAPPPQHASAILRQVSYPWLASSILRSPPSLAMMMSAPRPLVSRPPWAPMMTTCAAASAADPAAVEAARDLLSLLGSH